MTIGRANRDFVIPDVTISRQHAELVLETAALDVPRLVLKDQSRFGSTKVNGLEVPRDPVTGERSAQLKPLDVLLFGGCLEEYTVVANRLCFCVNKKTSEIQAFEEKTGHQVLTESFDSAATAFIHSTDSLSATDISVVGFTAAIYGIPIISPEYVKQFAPLRSGSSDSLFPAQQFELITTKIRDKALTNYRLVYAEAADSQFRQLFKLAGASDSGNKFLFIGFPHSEIPVCTDAEEVYALGELDVIAAILADTEIPEHFRVQTEFKSSLIKTENSVTTPNSGGVASGWISPVEGGLHPRQTQDATCKLVSMEIPDDFQVPPRRRFGIKRPAEDTELQFETWRSRKTGAAAAAASSSNKIDFDEFFVNPRSRRLGFRP